MFEPIVFISHFKIKEGKLNGFRQFAQQATEQIRASKPGAVAYLQYLNQEGTELSIIHVFPDADSFDRHVAGVDERAKAAFEFIEPTRREIYGAPSDQVLEMLIPPDDSGIVFNHKPQLNGGCIRLKPGE